MAYDLLLSPLRLGHHELRNRIVLSAHVTNLATSERTASGRHVAYYRERARGGTGLIVVESLAVHPTAGSSRLSMHAFDDAVIDGLAEVAGAVHAEGAMTMAQLNHGGREHNPMTTRRPLWSSSAVTSRQRLQTPHAMTLDEIDTVVEAFAEAAVRVREAGLDGVEINAGHGYLLHQFMTPIVNHRTDEYGGPLENRTRLPERVLRRVRERVGPDFVVGVRISGSEFLDGGIDSPMSRQIAVRLVAAGGLDFVSVSHSTYETLDTVVPDMSYGQAPFTGLARAVREAVSPVPVITAGRISTPDTAEQVLARGDADLVAMTRAQIADPYLAAKTAAGRAADIRWCIGCNQGCIGYTFVGADISCLQNPAAGDELHQPGDEPVPTTGPRRAVVVVGGGPAGMEAAWYAAALGHHVTLLEGSGQLGGILALAESLPSRQDLAGVRTYRERMLARHGVTVRLGVTATAEDVLALGPDVVIVATGSRPAGAGGAQGAHSAQEAYGAQGAHGAQGARGAEWAFDRTRAESGHCLVLDGDGTMTALTVAEELATRGTQVTLASRSGAPGHAVIGISLIPARRRLAALGVRQLPFHDVSGFVDGKAELTDLLNGTTTTVAADDVVAVADRRSDDGLYHQLAGQVGQVLLAGDAMAPRQAIDAIRDGRRAAQAIG
jgi:2,4-dienoyl-CoA reductase-like NADH-dependent reductase (Old Yellow Enzyme family)